MNPAVAAKVEKALHSYRAFVQGKQFQSHRLVEYAGVEMVGAFDIQLPEVEPRIRVAIMEGFRAMWAANGQNLVLCIWEPWDEPAPPPAWERVFAERDLD